ncbi:hypothetical protein EDD86DRAFT_198918 [Gorgonomyces haynaldii]|nr:hypothetical protein EDD86DRAFT_198918 [Gorgonomyces haynaldii]
MGQCTLKMPESNAETVPAFTRAKPLGNISENAREILLQTFLNYIESLGFKVLFPKQWLYAEAQRSPFLFNSLMAVGAVAYPEEQLEGHDCHEMSYGFYQAASSSFALEMERGSIVLIFGAFLLVIYCQEAAMLNSTINYKAIMLGLIIEKRLYLEPPEGTDQESHWKYCAMVNIFWVCYISDRLFSSILQSSPAIDESLIQLRLPIPEDEFDYQVYLHNKRSVAYDIAVMRSTADFVPFIPGCSPLGSYVLLIKIRDRATQLGRKWKQRNARLNSELKYSELSILSSVELWRMKAPSLASGTALCNSGTTLQDKFALLLVDDIIMTVCQGRLLSKLADGLDRFLIDPYFTLCFQAANECSVIVEELLAINPRLIGVPKHIQMFIVTSGIFHSVLVRLHPDPLVRNQSRFYLSLHLQALANISSTIQTFSGGTPYYNFLKTISERLLVNHFNPPGNLTSNMFSAQVPLQASDIALGEQLMQDLDFSGIFNLHYNDRQC